MKKALAAILAVLAHLSPIAADFAMDAARAYSNQTYDPFPQVYALIAASALFGLLYCGGASPDAVGQNAAGPSR